MGILDDILGRSSANASNAAAADTYAKQQAAINGVNAAGDDYKSVMDSLAAKFAPYGDAGKAALSPLMALLGLGGDQDAAVAAYRALPGYEAGLETGTRAVTAGANAGNMLNSGKTLKSLQRFGSDYEDQRVGSYMDRLMGLTGAGQQATAQEVATAGQGAGGWLDTRKSAFTGATAAAPTIGEGMVAGEAAKQGALTNLMSGAFNLGGRALGGGFGTNLGKKLFG